MSLFFKKSHWLILVKLNSSQEPETGNESTWLTVSSLFTIKQTGRRTTGGVSEGVMKEMEVRVKDHG